MSPTRSPPSSPQADGGAISELQYITHASSTSSPPCPDSAGVALSFSAPSKKRDSEQSRSRAVLGVASPQKKKLKYMPSQRRRSANGPAPMDVDSIVNGHDDVDGVDGDDDDGNDRGDGDDNVDVLTSPPRSTSLVSRTLTPLPRSALPRSSHLLQMLLSFRLT